MSQKLINFFMKCPASQLRRAFIYEASNNGFTDKYKALKEIMIKRGVK